MAELKKPEEFEFATYELRLDPTEGESAKIKVVQVGAGEPFTMQCIVLGEQHEEPDLKWLKDGNEIVGIDLMTVADTPPSGSPSKSIVVQGFDAAKHGGAYECSVKRKDEKYHSRRMRLEQKPGNTQFADGFTTCPGSHQGTCLNGGFCMMHKASESISCLPTDCLSYLSSVDCKWHGLPDFSCINDHTGVTCQQKENWILPTTQLPAEVRAGMIAMGFAVLGLLAIVIFAFFFISKQKRQIKRISGVVRNRFSNEESQYTDVEMNLLNYERDQPDGGKKFVAVETSDNVQFCWNCGYSQVLIDGSYQKRPSNALIKRLPGSTRGSLSGSTHRTPSFRGPGNKDLVETGHGATLNGPANGLMRVASLPTTPSAMGPFFEDFDRHCPDCLAQLRAHYYPDSPEMYDTPAFDGVPNGHHQLDHHALLKDVKKHTPAFQTQSQNPAVRPTALDFKAKSRSRLPGVSDERLEAPPRDSRKAVSSPSSPKSQRRMTLTSDQNHKKHSSTMNTPVDPIVQIVPSNGEQMA